MSRLLFSVGEVVSALPVVAFLLLTSIPGDNIIRKGSLLVTSKHSVAIKHQIEKELAVASTSALRGSGAATMNSNLYLTLPQMLTIRRSEIQDCTSELRLHLHYIAVEENASSGS